ncbi:unnamed protein product (macronuclear) [Paramecium tetraurelia]|uniref:Uncharacterized protein n=1 Tax=Paramecium tetraurelia TaxID=5888 RepID=A0CFL9_PARTE|nr:uncharacterized protein GSPATT00038026001 [Paramecium tetraurelia]CAK69586.1 unnamed protein product [Paramecium tetraurelia]|eukprot:XP_001436983.1 hypothetical protein (macronuclear) [Paramecium tetraurelia strain d4-2]
MELREAFITFLNYIKNQQQVTQILKNTIDKIVTQLQSKATDSEIKQLIFQSTSHHQRVNSQPTKPPLVVKQNALIGLTAFNFKPQRKISEQQKVAIPQETRQLYSNLEIQINKQKQQEIQSGKFEPKTLLLNDLMLCVRQFQYNTETLAQIYSHTSEIQTAYGIRVSQDIHGSGQINRKGSNKLFAGYNSKLMSDDQLVAIQNNFLMKKQIVKGQPQDYVNQSPLFMKKQIFLI